MNARTGAPAPAEDRVATGSDRIDVARHSGAVPDAAAARVGSRPPARLAVLGASGYSGQEFVRLAVAHPAIELAVLGSREHAGAGADQMMPGLDPRAAALPPLRDPGEIPAWIERGEVDTVVSCLPHGAFRALVAEHPALGARPERIVDLSSDHRGDGHEYTYGLPEAFRGEVARASRVANPGCYPTAFALALLPAVEAGWLDGPIAVSALSGVSGAGRAPALRTSFVEGGGASIYRAGAGHPHVAEMEQVLAKLGAAGPVGFVPQLVPMARGILLTASVPLARSIAPDEARALYRQRYAGERFVRVLGKDAWPETRAVAHSNRCDLAVTTLHGGRTLLATAALDNLGKGAAGQAIQNLNLMMGCPEGWGLSLHGVPW